MTIWALKTLLLAKLLAILWHLLSTKWCIPGVLGRQLLLFRLQYQPMHTRLSLAPSQYREGRLELTTQALKQLFLAKEMPFLWRFCEQKMVVF